MNAEGLHVRFDAARWSAITCVLLLFLAAACSSEDDDGTSPDAGVDDVGEADADPGTTNDCGGESILTYEGSAASPGDACGPCEEGELVCDGPDALECTGATEENACGGCAMLDGEPETECGSGGEWECKGTEAVVCVGEWVLQHAGSGCHPAESSCSMSVTTGSDRELWVAAVDDAGAPLENAAVDFELEIVQGADGAALSASSAFTNADGEASTTLTTAEAPDGVGQVRVEASLEGMSSTVEFLIGITPPDSAYYIIEFIYGGEAALEEVSPRLYEPEMSCAEIMDYYDAQEEWPEAALQLPPSTVAPDGSFSDATPSVQDGESFTVVAIGREDGEGEMVDVAFGCNDDNVEVEDGESVDVAVELEDLGE